MKQNKLKTKDIITVTLLTLINVVIFFSTSMLYATPITVLLMPVVLSLLNGIVFFILGTKVKKRGAIFIYCVIMGVLGAYIPYVSAYVITGLVAEIILAKTGYGSMKGLLPSYIIIQVAASFGSTFYPYMIALDALVAAHGDLGGRESVIKAAEMLTSGGFIFVLIGVVVAAIMGGLIGSRIVKKHIVTMKNTKVL